MSEEWLSNNMVHCSKLLYGPALTSLESSTPASLDKDVSMTPTLSHKTYHLHPFSFGCPVCMHPREWRVPCNLILPQLLLLSKTTFHLSMVSFGGYARELLTRQRSLVALMLVTFFFPSEVTSFPLKSLTVFFPSKSIKWLWRTLISTKFSSPYKTIFILCL